MKKLLVLTSVAVLLVALPLAYGQGQAPAQKTFEGQLMKVDVTAKTISVKGANAEMQFRYTEQTQVTGPEKDIQGLATKSGSPLKVTYQDAGNDHVATRIEVAAEKP
jgi:hypothetical protein